MTAFKRIKEIFSAIIMIVISVLMITDHSYGYKVIIAILSLYLVVRGISQIVYYFSMARFMTGGKISLYSGILMIDFGLFTESLTNVPHYYVLLYLAILHAFLGLVEILRAFESKKLASSWKLKASHGILDLLIAVFCIMHINNINTAVVIYSIGLIYSALMRIISACRRSRFIFIQ